MNIKRFLFIITPFFLLQCQFETTIDIKDINHSNQLAVIAQLSQIDTIYKVFVTQSFGILDTNGYDGLKNAEVLLLKNGAIFQSFEYNELEKSYFSSTFSSLENDESEYELIIEAPNFNKITSKQSMPKKTEIINGQLKLETEVNSSGQPLDEVAITFKDLPTIANYYMLKIYVCNQYILDNDTIAERSLRLGEVIDPIMKKIQDNNPTGLLFNDNSFNGDEVTLRVFDNFSSSTNIKLQLELFSLTEESFLFYQTYQRYYDTRGDLFSEPVIVYDNIENGHGIFGLAAVSIFEISL